MWQLSGNKQIRSLAWQSWQKHGKLPLPAEMFISQRCFCDVLVARLRHRPSGGILSIHQDCASKCDGMSSSNSAILCQPNDRLVTALSRPDGGRHSSSHRAIVLRWLSAVLPLTSRITHEWMMDLARALVIHDLPLFEDALHF